VSATEQPLVRGRSLTKRFGSFTAVDAINVDVRRGEAFGFLGPNGAGKSSTMRMIGCVSPVTDGTLEVLGMGPATEGARIRARLGVVPQEDTLDLELTVEENLIIYGRYFGLPRPVIRERARRLLDFVQLAERTDSKVEPLSGGMRRRLTIARSLINEPDLMLLDEPTTGLDPQGRHALWDRLFRLKQQGVTLVLTTHYMDEAEQLCDRLVVMVFFLAAMGLGLGTLVNQARTGGVDGLDYLSFLAPGLLAASAMQTAVVESTYPVMASIKWIKTYHAMLATPLSVLDVMVGHLIWIAIRVLVSSAVYLCVMALFGATSSPLALLALPAAVLTGMAFSAPVVAFAASRDNDSGFAALFRFGVMPMFLFSGVFFPIDQLPPALKHVAQLTPLWHGVDLCRDLSLGTADLGSTLLHVGYLTAWLIGGAVVAAITYRRRLYV
jgi:Nod factor-specific ABC transporter NodJ protein